MPAHLSLWDSTAAEPPLGQPLEDDVTCDLAIVGGGFTGLSTALHAAERGLSAHVLEAKSIGYGGSGRNVGYVNAGLWLPPQDVAAILGEEAAAPLIRTLGEMPAYVFELIEKHQMRAEATRTGTLHAAHSPRGFQDLRRRAEGWQRLGAPVELLDAGETTARTGLRGFHGGLLDHRAGTINPMGYARGLARAALAAGARISTDTTATALTRDGDTWRLSTARGSLSARYVVLGTNAYGDGLWPGLRQSYATIPFFQLATEPLGARVGDVLPQGHGLWDTAPIMLSLRRDAAGRLIVGSMGAVHGGTRGLSRLWAARKLAKHLPGLGPVAFEAAWHGRIAMTPDHVFRIHRLAPGLFAPVGYNGRGITTGTMFGRALAEHLTGTPESALPLPITEPRPITFRTAKTAVYHSAFAVNQLWRTLVP